MEKARKVYAYLRVSRIDGQTTEQQLMAIRREYSEDTELIVLEEKASGWKGERPVYDKLKALIEKGSVKELVFFAVDRIGRNTREAANFIELALEKGVKIKCIAQNIAFDGAIGKLIWTMLSAFAQMESDMKSIRLREKNALLKSKGKFIGHGRAPHAFTERLIRKAPQVYRLFDEGNSYSEVAYQTGLSESSLKKLMKAKGHPLPSAKQISILFPDWWKQKKEDRAYITLEEVRRRYRLRYGS